MVHQFSREEIAEGVFFSSYNDDRFKVNRIDIVFTDMLDRERASVNALIPSILSRSNNNYPTMRALNKKLSSLYSATLGDSVRKKGDIQIYELFATVLADRYAIGEEKILSETVKLLCDCLFDPYLENGVFPEKNIEVLKQNLVDSNDAEINDKALYAYRLGTSETFKDEPASISVFGENEDIKIITPKAAYAAYKDMLISKHVEIICVGSGDFSEASEMLKKAFVSVGRKPSAPPKNTKTKLKKSPCNASINIDVAQSKLYMSFKSDYDNEPAQCVMSSLLGGDVTSKLFTIVREKLSLCYYCYSRFNSAKNTMTIESGVEKQNIEKAKKEIIHQLNEISNGNFTDEDLLKIKRSMQNDLRSVNDWIGSISNWYLARIMDEKANGQIITPEEMIEKFLSVSREEVINAAKSFKIDTVFVLTSSEEEESE